MKGKAVTVQVERYNRAVDPAPYYQKYRVEIDPIENISVLGLIQFIHNHLDRTLAYREVKCHLGVCTACLMNINGKNLRACSTLVPPGDEIMIAPARKSGPVIRDLVVDFGLMREQEAIDEVLEKR